MNAHQTELNFSRRDLLKGGGALVIGFSMAGVPAGDALAARGDVVVPFDIERDRHLDRDPCRQHRDRVYRQRRIRPGQHHRSPANRGRRA